VLSLTGAWLILYGGGFHHGIGRFTRTFVFVDGAPALFMAALQLACAALAFTALLRDRLGLNAAAILAFGLVFVPAAGFLLLRW